MDNFMEMESTSKETTSVLPSSQDKGKATTAWINENNQKLSNNYYR